MSTNEGFIIVKNTVINPSNFSCCFIVGTPRTRRVGSGATHRLYPEIGFLDESWRGFLLLCIRAGLLNAEFSQIEVAQLVRQAMLQSERPAGSVHSGDTHALHSAEPVGRFSPSQFRLCIAALGVAVLKVPPEHVVAEICRRLDRDIIAESEANHSMDKQYSTGTSGSSRQNNYQQQKRRWEAVQLVSWASVGTMSSPDIGQKLRAKFLHCARELNNRGSNSVEPTTTDSPLIRQADVVWIMEQFHLSPEYMSLAELQKEVQALCANRNMEPTSTRNSSLGINDPGETKRFDFPTFIGVFEKLATAKAATVSLATFAERAHAKSRAEREARELKDNPNIFPDDQNADLDFLGWDHTNPGGRDTDGGALVRYSQVPVRAVPEAGRLDALVLQQVVQALEQKDPFRTGIVPVDSFQHCLSPLDRAQVQANVSGQFGVFECVTACFL